MSNLKDTTKNNVQKGGKIFPPGSESVESPIVLADPSVSKPTNTSTGFPGLLSKSTPSQQNKPQKKASETGQSPKRVFIARVFGVTDLDQIETSEDVKDNLDNKMDILFKIFPNILNDLQSVCKGEDLDKIIEIIDTLKVTPDIPGTPDTPGKPGKTGMTLADLHSKYFEIGYTEISTEKIFEIMYKPEEADEPVVADEVHKIENTASVQQVLVKLEETDGQLSYTYNDKKKLKFDMPDPPADPGEEPTPIVPLNIEITGKPLTLGFPRELLYINNITELQLEDRRLKYIPSDLDRLINLKTLSFKNNFISSIPESFTKVVYSLKKLDLSENFICRKIPGSSKMGFGSADKSFFEALADKSKEPEVITNVPAEIGKLQKKLRRNQTFQADTTHTYTYISNVVEKGNEYTVTLSSKSYTKSTEATGDSQEVTLHLLRGDALKLGNQLTDPDGKILELIHNDEFGTQIEAYKKQMLGVVKKLTELEATAQIQYDAEVERVRATGSGADISQIRKTTYYLSSKPIITTPDKYIFNIEIKKENASGTQSIRPSLNVEFSQDGYFQVPPEPMVKFESSKMTYDIIRQLISHNKVVENKKNFEDDNEETNEKKIAINTGFAKTYHSLIDRLIGISEAQPSPEVAGMITAIVVTDASSLNDVLNPIYGEDADGKRTLKGDGKEIPSTLFKTVITAINKAKGSALDKNQLYLNLEKFKKLTDMRRLLVSMIDKEKDQQLKDLQASVNGLEQLPSEAKTLFYSR